LFITWTLCHGLEEDCCDLLEKRHLKLKYHEMSRTATRWLQSITHWLICHFRVGIFYRYLFTSFHLDLCLDITITIKIYLCQSIITEVSFFAIMSQYSQTWTWCYSRIKFSFGYMHCCDDKMFCTLHLTLYWLTHTSTCTLRKKVQKLSLEWFKRKIYLECILVP